jgi:two-component system, NarL family, response regulator LiaR
MEKPIPAGVRAIRVVLADDHAILRQGTVELLRREPDLEVVGEAADGQQAVDLAQTLRPDIVVMDVRLPVISGIEATRRIRETLPGVQVLVLSAYDDDQFVISSLRAGASGYLLKNAPVSELVKAIRQVQAGESPLDPAIARKIVANMIGGTRSGFDPGNTASAAIDVTARELEILRLLGKGMSNRAIGEALFISERTVQTHLTSLFAKMQVTSRLDAVLTAVRRGWINLD